MRLYRWLKEPVPTARGWFYLAVIATSAYAADTLGEWLP